MGSLSDNITDRGLFMVDCEDEPLECDFCDQLKPLAHINTITGDVFCVCKDCIQDWLNELT